MVRQRTGRMREVETAPPGQGRLPVEIRVLVLVVEKEIGRAIVRRDGPLRRAWGDLGCCMPERTSWLRLVIGRFRGVASVIQRRRGEHGDGLAFPAKTVPWGARVAPPGFGAVDRFHGEVLVLRRRIVVDRSVLLIAIVPAFVDRDALLHLVVEMDVAFRARGLCTR